MSNPHIKEIRESWARALGNKTNGELAAVLIGRNQLKQIEDSIKLNKMQPGDPYLGGQFLMGVPFIKVDEDDYIKLVYGEIKDV